MMSSREKVLLTLVIVLMVVLIIGGTWMASNNRSKADEVTPPTTTTTTTTITPEETTTTEEVTTPKVTLVLKPGLNLVTVPYILSPSDGKTVLLGLSTRDASYLNDEGKWVSLYKSGNVTPGQGFWVKSERGEAYQLPVSATPVDASTPFTISLKKGWNAIGNPFAKDITWDPIVKTTKGTTTLKKAIEAKIVTVGYLSDATSKQYKTLNPGDKLSAFSGILMQSGGENVELIVSPN